MLQRVQTVYLILAFLMAGAMPFLLPLFTLVSGKQLYFMQNMIYVTLFGLSLTLSLLSILSYNKRQNQFVINRLNMILNLILLGLFVARALNLSGETDLVSEKGIEFGVFLPIVIIVLLVMANRAIKKDEDLVKSADRLR